MTATSALVEPMVLQAPEIDDIAELEQKLWDAFDTIRQAIEDRPVVVVLDDADLQGVTSTTRVTFAHGLLGLVRAFGVEGGKPGWRISALSVTSLVSAQERRDWIRTLGDSPSACGTLVRLGGEQLGKVPV